MPAVVLFIFSIYLFTLAKSYFDASEDFCFKERNWDYHEAWVAMKLRQLCSGIIFIMSSIFFSAGCLSLNLAFKK